MVENKRREEFRKFCAQLNKLRLERETRLAAAGLTDDNEATELYLTGNLSLERYMYLLHGNRRYSQKDLVRFCAGLRKVREETKARLAAVGLTEHEAVEQYLKGEISLDRFRELMHGPND